MWWKPQGGVSKAEREWLSEKYPNFEQQFGPIWDQLIANINNGAMEKTLPETLPWLCNFCHLPVGTAAAHPVAMSVVAAGPVPGNRSRTAAEVHAPIGTSVSSGCSG